MHTFPAAVRNLPGGEGLRPACRTAEIVADAAVAVLARPSRSCTGRFLTDEEVLAEEGVRDLSRYRVGDPGAELAPDIFL